MHREGEEEQTTWGRFMTFTNEVFLLRFIFFFPLFSHPKFSVAPSFLSLPFSYFLFCSVSPSLSLSFSFSFSSPFSFLRSLFSSWRRIIGRGKERWSGNTCTNDSCTNDLCSCPVFLPLFPSFLFSSSFSLFISLHLSSIFISLLFPITTFGQSFFFSFLGLTNGWKRRNVHSFQKKREETVTWKCYRNEGRVWKRRQTLTLVWRPKESGSARFESSRERERDGH